MRNPVVRSTKEEIKRKLMGLYSNSLDSGRDVLDFDRNYDFFSTDETRILKFSSNWFRPDKYSTQIPTNHNIKNYQSLCQDDGEIQKLNQSNIKRESLLKCEKQAVSNLTRDLEVLGKTPYQIGVDGEKFRVVAATLQKCNSPFVRRTFHFTSNGIVEASEKKDDPEVVNITPMIKQTRTLLPQQKFVRIKRFRVIKKDDLPVNKYILPQKIKITNGEKTRFLTVRIRSKNSTINHENVPFGLTKPKIQKIMPTIEIKEPESIKPSVSFPIQKEELEDAEQNDSNASEPDTVSLDATEEELEEKIKDFSDIKEEECEQEEKSETGEIYNCENCGKTFLTHLSCVAHFRSHQRQVCQYCSKKFLTMKLLKEHVKMQHQHQVVRTGTSEDRITTATSKFGRTRQVLNVAGLRSKYKML